ncbi:MAG TPA: hypothetical protein VMC85_20515 [Desulfomonilaceae bacterium]|nr:hypothetical protein [Desulfomonilaceae bacterium]
MKYGKDQKGTRETRSSGEEQPIVKETPTVERSRKTGGEELVAIVSIILMKIL